MTTAKQLNQKHTSGPWTSDYMPSTGFGSGYGKSQIIDSKGRALAGVAIVDPEHGPLHRDGGFSKEALDTVEANARLIAAAPELLQALRAALVAVERATKTGSIRLLVGDTPWKRAARQAIAKAQQV